MSEKVCRLCLQTISNNGYQTIMESMLKTLKLSLKISAETVMCVECASCLQIFSKFIPGVYVGDGTFPLSDPQNEIKLEPLEIETASNLKPLIKTEIKCSFCTETHGIEDLIPLNESKENKFLVNMLQQYMNKNTEELLTCGTCRDALQGVSSFILKCSKVEEKISEYIRLKGTDDKGQVELKEVQQFMFRPILKLDVESIGVNKLEEPCDEDITMEKPEIKYETETSHPELIIKTEDAAIKSEQTDCDITDIKSEQSDCDRFQESTIENKIPNDPLPKLLVTSDTGKCNETMFYCEVHSYKTRHEGYWKRHLLLHKNPETYKCELCTYEAKYKFSLKLHALTHKSVSELKMFKCEYCQYVTKHKFSLNKHLLIHKDPSDVKMFKCELCSYTTKRKHHLRKHFMVHKSPSEIEMFKCEFCSYMAKRNSNLTQHLLTHKSPSEIKMFKCELCSYEVKRKCNLERHLLTHKSRSEVEMFKCALCSYEAKYKSNLQKHISAHKSPSEMKNV